MPGKTPTRTCIACGSAADKRSLVRIVRCADGKIALDTTGRCPGRGAYVCLNAACMEKALNTRLLASKLRTKTSPEDCERLKEEFRALLAGKASISGDGE